MCGVKKKRAVQEVADPTLWPSEDHSGFALSFLHSLPPPYEGASASPEHFLAFMMQNQDGGRLGGRQVWTKIGGNHLRSS